MRILLLVCLLSCVGCGPELGNGPEGADAQAVLSVDGRYGLGEWQRQDQDPLCLGPQTLDPILVVAQYNVNMVDVDMGSAIPRLEGYVTETGFWVQGLGPFTDGGRTLGVALALPGAEVVATVQAEVFGDHGLFDYRFEVLQLGVPVCKVTYAGRLERGLRD